MGILQTPLPRKNDLSLDKLLLGFLLEIKKKYTYIEINAKEWLENLYYSLYLSLDWLKSDSAIKNVFLPLDRMAQRDHASIS